MTEELIDRHESAETDDKASYEKPAFSVVDLALITLAGSPGVGDSKNENTGEVNEFIDDDDDYDEDDPMGDPWGSRGGGG